MENKLDKYEEYVRRTLPERRIKHTIGVRDTAVELAKKYGCCQDKAAAAALLHDIGKYLHREELIDIIRFKDEKKNKTLNLEPQVYHGYASAIIAQRDLNESDPEVLDAVRYHTTGRENMTLLEKIIYIADYIEPNRRFDGIQDVRDMAFMDLDKSILMAMNNTIIYIIEQNGIIDFDTILARNYILAEWGK